MSVASDWTIRANQYALGKVKTFRQYAESFGAQAYATVMT